MKHFKNKKTNSFILIFLIGGLFVFGYNFSKEKSFKLEEREIFQIVNFHEHIESINEAKKLLKIMNENNISKTVLLGSPNYTLYLEKNMGFEEYEKNNLEIIKIAKTYPERFIAFPALNPLDENNLEKLKDYLQRGARGLKLYYGHGGSHGKGFFHVIPLDDPRMDSVFEYCQKNGIPIVFHINMGKYYEEFISLMNKFPNLKIIVAHFMLSMWDEERLTKMEKLFEKYPNLYTDISLGRQKFLVDGFKHISKNPELYRNFIIKHKNRFLFGTDIVVTEVKLKSKFPVSENTRVYRDFLEKRKYKMFSTNEYLNGLDLNKETLKIIYEINPTKIMSK